MRLIQRNNKYSLHQIRHALKYLDMDGLPELAVKIDVGLNTLQSYAKGEPIRPAEKQRIEDVIGEGIKRARGSI